MKITILFEFQNGPWGGGNQFLKALREKFRNRQRYSENCIDADVVMFNSHHWGSQLIKLYLLKMKKPGVMVVHRVDGLISMVRGNEQGLPIDKAIAEFNDEVTDATIFQSDWSRQCWRDLGMSKVKPEAVIINAPDPKIFYPQLRNLNNIGDKIRIAVTSWSPNLRKGFSHYQFLDKNLDFSRFEMTFIGNSPIYFKNIRYLAPLPSRQLAEELRRHQIFLTASIDDSCSNSLIEAMHCGLFPVAIKSGGTPEIVGNQGLLFEGEHDLLPTLDKAAKQFSRYHRNELPDMESVANQYYDFMESVLQDIKTDRISPRKLGFYRLCRFLLINLKLRFWPGIKSRLNNIYTFSS